MNAVQLIEGSSKLRTLPTPDFTSAKLFALAESREEKQLSKSVLENYQKILQAERICHKSTLSIAHWDEVRNIAVVDVPRGGNLHRFSFQSKEGTFLYPEDTLFLIDQGLLEVLYKELPLSLKEAYILIVPLLPSYEYYEVFAYLCRLGYVVKRNRKHHPQVTDPYDTSDKTNGDNGSKWGRGLGSPVCEETMKEYEMEDDAEPMSSGYVKNLWSEYPDKKPCIRPSEALSTAAVFSKLQVMKLLRLRDINHDMYQCSTDHDIHFDVFLSRKMKKQNEDRPQFRVVVCKYEDPPPSVITLVRLTKESDGVSLKLGIVNDGAVSFYGMFSTDLPNLTTVG